MGKTGIILYAFLFVISVHAREHRFIVNAPASTPLKDILYLTGNILELCQWKPTCHPLKPLGYGVYEASIEVPDSIESLNLKITRGSWDTQAAAADGLPLSDMLIDLSEEERHVISISNWKDSGPLKVTGNVISLGSVYSPQLGNSRNIAVWLPPSYELSQKRYPVIYVQDGQNIFDPKTSFWGIDWGVDETMTRLIAKKQIKEAIVVALDSTKDRDFEYDYRKKGPLYAKFLVETIKTKIDKAYRTLPDRNSTFLMGSSMGALISTTIMWHYPTVFSRAAGISFPAFFDKSSTQAILENTGLPQVPLFLYLDHGDYGGDEDYGEAATRFFNFLLKVGFPKKHIEYLTFPFADHNEAAWARRVDVPLRYLLGNP